MVAVAVRNEEGLPVLTVVSCDALSRFSIHTYSEGKGVSDSMRTFPHVTGLLAGLLMCVPLTAAHAQFGYGAPPSDAPSNPTALLTDPTSTPGLQFLLDLDKKFSRETLAGGGAAFSAWFAENAVSLANGKPPVQGRDAIAAQAKWSAKDYQLSWVPDGGTLGPGGQMGYTWGHYSGRAKDAEGEAVLTTGRYIEVWQKQTDGQWKVVLDASNDGPALDCCKLP